MRFQRSAGGANVCDVVAAFFARIPSIDYRLVKQPHCLCYPLGRAGRMGVERVFANMDEAGFRVRAVLANVGL